VPNSAIGFTVTVTELQVPRLLNDCVPTWRVALMPKHEQPITLQDRHIKSFVPQLINLPSTTLSPA
jgi:hypothetical protein